MTKISSASSSRKKPKGNAATKEVALPQVMSQIAYKLDPVTLKKTYKGFLISIAAAFLAGFSLLGPEVKDFIASGDAIDWRPALVAAWGSFHGGIVNAVYQFVRGVKPNRR